MSTTHTEIAWTDRTWNPVRGCARVSEGCRHCYAEKVAGRFSGPGLAYEGLTEMHPSGERRWNGKIRLVPEALDEPLRWRKPQRIFVNSMSDLFHEDVPDEFIDRVFAVMALASHHTFQVLTKRPERMARYLSLDRRQSWGFQAARVLHEIRGGTASEAAREAEAREPKVPLPNVHLMVSVEDQPAADERIPLLLQTPAAVRGLSVEPLLGPVEVFRDGDPHALQTPIGVTLTGNIDWVIVGGESGPGARPCDVAWIRSIVEQCKAACVPCFVKQLGGHAILDPRYDRTISGWTRRLRDRKGGDPEEWPEDLRVREFPGARP